MDLLSILSLFAIWGFVGWTIRVKFLQWRERRDYRRKLHPKKKRRLWPFKQAVRPPEAKRRTSYHPPFRK